MSPETASAIDRAVEAAFERDQVPFLSALVEQSSCSREPEDVEACFAILDREAERVGLGIERVPDARGEVAAHRVYTTAACTPATRAIAIVGHLDTVFPRSLGLARFRREGDVARGAGVLDMKSGVTTPFAALAALRSVGPDLAAGLALRIVIVSDEEIGSPSSAALYARLAPVTTSALVLEAGREHDRIVTRRRGGGLYTVEAHGQAAHAGNAYLEGTNAILALAFALPKIEALGDPSRGTTLSVGLIEGGSAKNTVPERAVAHLDARYETSEEVQRVEDGMRAIVADPFAGASELLAPPRLRRARLSLSGGMTRPPMQPLPGTAALCAAYAVHAAAVGLGTNEAPLQGGGSDANLLVHHGVPCIDGLGPFGRFFHEAREWCSLESLARRTRALARMLADGGP